MHVYGDASRLLDAEKETEHLQACEAAARYRTGAERGWHT